MRRLGNILLHSTDAARIDALCDRLNERDCAVAVCETVDEVAADAAYGRPDLIVVDAASVGPTGLAGMAAARGGADLAMIPLLVWAAEEVPGLYEFCAELAAEDAFVGDAEAGFDEFFLRLRPLMRLSTQLAEVRRRTALAGRFGLAVAAPDFSAPLPAGRVLVLGGPPDLEERIAAALPAGSAINAETDPEAARDALSSAGFDAAIVGIGGGLSGADALSFCRGLRDTPMLFNLPIVVLGDLPGTREEVFAAGATEVLADPADGAALGYFLGACIRRQHLRGQIRETIAATRAEPTVDPETNTYSPVFLRVHLNELAEEARHWQRHLSVLIFSLSGGPAGSGAETGIGRVAEWIDGLVRLEDMVARWGDNGFCVALPDTAPVEAPAVIERITGFLGRSGVSVGIGVAGLGADDDPAAMLARAEDDMEERVDAG